MNETSGRQLHDKATRGQTLTESDRTLLEAWYQQEDEQESRLLETGRQTHQDALQQQIHAALEQIKTVTQQIQALYAENGMLQREVADLYRQLAATEKARTA